MMKKVVILSLLTLYLFSTTELNQLLKVPLLFEHFLEHKSQNKKITFFDFFYMHYSQVDDHDGDKEKDQKLPFKSHSFCNSSISFVTLTAVQNITFSDFELFKIETEKTNFYTFFVSSSHLKAIWQPPQIS